MNSQPGKTIHTFTDAAIFNSSLGCLRTGAKSITCVWDLKSLRTLTYLLLIGRLHVLPAMGSYRKPVGRYREAVRQLPELEEFVVFPDKRRIESQALQFQEQHVTRVLQAWNLAIKGEAFFEWGEYHKTIAPVDHMMRHGCLIRLTTIPLAMMVTGLSRRELLGLYQASQKLAVIKTWSKLPLENETKILFICWMLDGLVRVTYYDLLARTVGFEYVSHEFRSTLREQRNSRKLNQTFQYLANLIAEQALAQRRVAERTETYFNLIKSARRDIATNTLAVSEAEGADAVRHALTAADQLGVTLNSDAYERALEDMRMKDLTELKSYVGDRLKSFSNRSEVLRNVIKTSRQVGPANTKRFDEFKERLAACPTGKAYFARYEELCTEMWSYIFGDKLGTPLLQRATSDRVQRRDCLFPNLTKSTFFKRIFDRFQADFLILDFKNYRDELGSDVIEDVSHYANRALGNFVIAVSRKGGGSAATAGQIRVLKNREIAVITVSDEHMLEMIDRKDRGEEPEDVLSNLLDDLLVRY
jgi:hypothetical protein